MMETIKGFFVLALAGVLVALVLVLSVMFTWSLLAMSYEWWVA